MDRQRFDNAMRLAVMQMTNEARSLGRLHYDARANVKGLRAAALYS